MTTHSSSGFIRLGVMRLVLVLGVLALSFGLLPSAQSYPTYRAKPAKATALPAWQIKGAIQLQKTDIKTVQSLNKTTIVVCGKMNSKWYAGTILAAGSKKGYFLGLTTESKNLAMRANSILTSGNDNRKKRQELRALSNQKHREGFVGTDLCRATGGSGSGSGSAVPLRFNFSNAVGVTVGSAASRKGRPSTRQSSGGIKAVLANGALRDAIASGTATISKVAVSPSGQIVIAFSNKVNLDNASSSYSSTGCVIVTVDRSTGVPTCIDDSLSNLQNYGSGVSSIQFDASGGIYYVGSACTQTCMTVFRRFKNGALTELINAQISVHEFIVADIGTVFMLGSTSATNVSFNRRYSAAGGILNLGEPAMSSQAQYRKYSDGNVYMYGRSPNDGIARFNVAADTMDTTLWIGPSATQDWSAHCAAAGSGTGPCTSGIFPTSYSRLVVETSSGKNFQPGTDGLVQTFPTLSTFTLPISTVSLLGASGNVVLAAGTTTSGENKLVKFDSDTNTVSTLASRASANGEIEFYHVEPSSDGYALFDGLRFNDNTYVIGKINYSTGEVTILSTVTGKLDDFKAF